MTDIKVAEAEARKAALHSGVTSKVDTRINTEIAGQAATSTEAEQARVAEVARHLRDRALAEAVRGERAVLRARAAARLSQFIDYGFVVLYTLFGTRLVLALIAASTVSGFVRFIRLVTDPFYSPFRGMVPSPTTDTGNTLVIPLLVALVVYMLLHLGVNGLLRMVGHRKTSI